MQQQNQRFFTRDETRGIDLFKLHVRSVTLHYNMADLRKGQAGSWQEVLGPVGTNLQINCYCNDERVRETINKVGTMDGNTVSIGDQGQNVLSRQRNKRSAG